MVNRGHFRCSATASKEWTLCHKRTNAKIKLKSCENCEQEMQCHAMPMREEIDQKGRRLLQSVLTSGYAMREKGCQCGYQHALKCQMCCQVDR